jgi:hypothetical protein
VRGCEGLHHDVLDRIRQHSYFLVASSLDDIYTNPRESLGGSSVSPDTTCSPPVGKVKCGRTRKIAEKTKYYGKAV